MSDKNLSKTSVNIPHPTLFELNNGKATADKLHRLLLDLSNDTSEKEVSSAIRATADFFREKYYGLSDKRIQSKIISLLEEYFDGESYRGLEIVDIAEETGIKEETLLPVINRMVRKGILIQGRRRRFQEYGEHYNPLYKLNK